MSKRVIVDGCPDRISGNGEEKAYYVVSRNNDKVIESKAGCPLSVHVDWRTEVDAKR